MEKLVSIGKAAKILGVSEITLRRWDEAGRLVAIKTEEGHRRYDVSKIEPETGHRRGFQVTTKSKIWNVKSKIWNCFVQETVGLSR
jgi:hypothetical protein